MTQTTTPLLVTFDGEARSGKGTIVQMTKDYLRDECGYKVMLIDRGQTFRVLVVAARQAGVDIDRPSEIDDFLTNPDNIHECVDFVKAVYHMSKAERDELLYTNEISEDSAKVGARPSSQVFVRDLTKKWLHDAGQEGYQVVLVDGRALESIAREMHTEQLCDYRAGLYFICDAEVGARRTLGLAAKSYDELSEIERTDVAELVEQIDLRNKRDRERQTEPLLPPSGARAYRLPEVPSVVESDTTPMAIIDTSADLNKMAMSKPVARYVAEVLKR